MMIIDLIKSEPTHTFEFSNSNLEGLSVLMKYVKTVRIIKECISVEIDPIDHVKDFFSVRSTLSKLGWWSSDPCCYMCQIGLNYGDGVKDEPPGAIQKPPPSTFGLLSVRERHELFQECPARVCEAYEALLKKYNEVSA